MRIIADEAIPFLRGTLEPYAEVGYLPAGMIDRESVKNADALLVRTRTKVNEHLLEGSNVRFVGTATIGTDHIDTDWCNNHGITVANAPGCNAFSVVQYIAASLLSVHDAGNYHLQEKTLGIIGVGNVGSKVAKLAEAFGMKVLLNDPPRARTEGNKKFVSLDTLLAGSDIVTLHVPLITVGIDRTYHLIAIQNLNKMKDDAWLINSSRGEVVETNALRNALETKKIKGAVIDVWENEPFANRDLIRLVSIATPHIAGYSLDGKANGTAMIIRELARFARLPLENWFPEKFPELDPPEIQLKDIKNDILSVLRDVVKITYDIHEEDARFRKNPADFELLRNNYPVRREFSAFKVIPGSANRKIIDCLVKTGFQIAGQ